MNVSRFIAELRKELVRIDEVILAIERFAEIQPRRRGRPPGLHSVRRRRQGIESGQIQKAIHVGNGQV
jgi:hypothetical protein